ncbi:helix-turn-helix domain-containing protein [Anabaena sp. FACHB-709]|uniref:Transcriptional regulator n=2 Tax=Nostocaceae TaxID=1162 RepID=A0A1Z4KFB7_ANAVA|nr:MULTISPECIES: AraC family transcriptional regulator [Nostocaceae]BAY67655.1 transcriptional regulator [Trichormus variabilis NIES-23]HBW33027.1 PAS domain S-box protein [Nostoc sp. UBA8866]MBD2173916.1 helix-turn-helix domain-containing protein [Anabaena cylindrica FACHB-318]MBD2265665.1 helix-turn-helix domain-containing protein [Anabaena sp. FACHB-709]MBD2275022.1 helix-turn-helix domain-containing protein [Nostoc sp. PCC 7120 = FACHB-418]
MVFDSCISEQHTYQVTQQLEKELRLTNLLMDCVTDAVFWVKPNTRILYVNDAACSLVGYSREELLCMSIQYLNLEFLMEVWLQHWETIKQKGSLYFESLYKTQAGLSLPVQTTVTYMEEDGREYGCISIREIKKRQPESFQLQQNPALDIVETKKSSEPCKSIFPSGSQLNQVFKFIESNYDQSIGLRDVAQAVGYSPAYLTDLVRRHTGETVNHWIIKRRMVAARTLLLETDQCVNQIAEAVGYQHEGHFFRQFRQYHDTTPHAWRKMQRQVATSQ